MPRVVVLGDHDDAVFTHREIDAALRLFPSDVTAEWLATEGAVLDGADGIWLAPGSPYRDEDAVFAALTQARTSGMPLLGTCGGFQYALLESHATSRASRPRTPKPRPTPAIRS